MKQMSDVSNVTCYMYMLMYINKLQQFNIYLSVYIGVVR